MFLLDLGNSNKTRKQTRVGLSALRFKKTWTEIISSERIVDVSEIVGDVYYSETSNFSIVSNKNMHSYKTLNHSINLPFYDFQILTASSDGKSLLAFSEILGSVSFSQ